MRKSRPDVVITSHLAGRVGHGVGGRMTSRRFAESGFGWLGPD